MGDSGKYKSRSGWYRGLINCGIILVLGAIIHYLLLEAARIFYSQQNPPVLIDHYGASVLIIVVPIGVVLIIVGLYMRQKARTERTKPETYWTQVDKEP
ncbi:MAG: hypothetical protein ACFFCF_05050 [Promethearchaeota archaeon]